MKLKIHQDNIVTIARGEFFNWYPIISKESIGQWIFDCELEISYSERKNYSC